MFWMAIFNFGMFILTLLLTIAAFYSAVIARRASRGTVLKQLIEEYSDWDMCQAIRQLQKLRNESGKDFEKDWKRRLDKGEKDAHIYGEARRKVSHYFQKIYELHQMGVIGKKVMVHFSKYPGVDIFLGIVEPLETELNEDYDKRAFNAFRSIKTMPSKVDQKVPPERS